MVKIGIISGGGELPINIGRSLLKKNYQICFFYIKGYSDKTKYDNYENVEITIDSFSKILNLLKERKIDQIVMAGTIIRPSNYAIKNKNKGLRIFKKIGEADIGQSLVVQNQLVIGIECFEGTDELIKRCDKYKKSGDKKILIKLSKYNQHSILDVPTIGIKTLKNLKKHNYEGLFIEKNNCIILDKDKSINFCNDNNLFLSTTNKID